MPTEFSVYGTGCVQLWDMTKEFAGLLECDWSTGSLEETATVESPLATLNLHQSGVNDIDVIFTGSCCN